MKRYYFQLLDEQYNDLGAFIPDGSNKRWMQENEIKHAQLSVNSMITDNVLDIIDIEVQ